MAEPPRDAEGLLVDRDPRRARTLPPRAFTDPAFLARELDTVYRSAWLLVPPRANTEMREDARDWPALVATRGAHAPVTLLDRPFFLQRDWDGELHLFPNVCTHAWHTLVPGAGRERVIRCPQHGRRFDCAGRVLDQPGMEDAPHFPGADDHLPAFPVREWGPFLFAAPGVPECAFGDVIGHVTESLGTLDLAALERKPVAGEVRELAGNWKLHAWNYLDSLHIPFIHKQPGGLADAVELASYRTELHDHAVLQWAYARDPAHGFPADALPARFRADGKRVFALWWFVWPNLALNFYPWGLSVNLYQPVPGKPERTLFHWYHYAWDDAKYADRERAWMLGSVDAEDVEALTQVNRGVRSGLAVRGRFAGDAEKGAHWLHHRVAERVPRAAPSG